MMNRNTTAAPCTTQVAIAHLTARQIAVICEGLKLVQHNPASAGERETAERLVRYFAEIDASNAQPEGCCSMIPQMTDPLGRHWRQPADIREAPMDDTHVLLSPRQIAGLPEYSTSYPSGTYDGKCWKREGEDCWYLCWYEPHRTPGKIGIGHRIILEVEQSGAPIGDSQ